MIDVGRWLDEIGLPQYAAAFAAEAIDASVLPTLTDVELRDLGLPLGTANGSWRRSRRSIRRISLHNQGHIRRLARHGIRAPSSAI